MSELETPRFIDTEQELQGWVEHCRSAEQIAVDTESDSFHHYREKVCLIQMTALGVDAIIDPLALDGLEPLAELFADPRRIKIFHDATYDLIGLRRDFGFRFAGLFDTMISARLLGWRSFGLAAILHEHFGVTTDKRLQRSDWARRPLSAEQIVYARYDTHFLPAMVELLTKELTRGGRFGWAEEEFRRLPATAARIEPRSCEIDPLGFWKIRGVGSLWPDQLGRVRALYLARERIAQQLDRPPFKVFGDAVLVELAKHPPRSLGSLRPRPGLRGAGVARFGTAILEALREATPVHGRPPDTVRRRHRYGRLLDPHARARYEALRTVRRAKADELGLDPEVLLGNAFLEELAREPPSEPGIVLSHPEIVGWRAPLLGDALFKALSGGNGQSAVSHI